MIGAVEAYRRARQGRNVRGIAPDPGSYSVIRRDCGKARSFFLRDRPACAGGSLVGEFPMTDIAYLCHNCGSVHDVESIRQNLMLDLRRAASYELSGRSTLDLRARRLRWRMTWGLTRGLWPWVSAPSVFGLRRSAGGWEGDAAADRPAVGRDVRARVIRLYPVPAADGPVDDRLESSPRTDIES